MKKVKINNFELQLLTNKEFKKSEYHVIGDVDFKTKKRNAVREIEIDETVVYVGPEGKGDGKCIGYYVLNDTECVRILKKNAAFIIWIILGIALLALIASLFIPAKGTKRPILFSIFPGITSVIPEDIIDLIDIDIPDNPSGNPEIEIDDNLDNWDGEYSLSGERTEASAESIIIPGYADLVFNDKVHAVNLINPDANTVYMVYTIKNGDEVLFESKGIAPGKQLTLTFYNEETGEKLLEKGEYTLNFIISTYDVDTMSACNGANQTVKVTIK